MKYLTVILLAILFISPLALQSSVIAQQEQEIIGTACKVAYTPSPDERAVGHFLYLENVTTKIVTKLDMKMEEPFPVPQTAMLYSTQYKVSATAYDAKGKESVHSNYVLVTLIPPLGPPAIIELTCP